MKNTNSGFKWIYKPAGLFAVMLLIVFVCYSNLTAQSPDWLKDVSHVAGLDSAKGSRILCIDVNNDNYPDLFWGTGDLNKNRYKLYLNIPDPENPGMRKYIDYTDESNVNQNRDPNKNGRIVDIAAFADVDNDGDLDLVTSIYYHRWQMYNTPELDPGDRSEVLLNDGTGKFKLVENNGLTNLIADPAMPSGIINATGMAFLDYDYDGKIDLYISTWFSDYAANLANNGNGFKMPDVLLKGNGDGTFTKVTNNGVQIEPEPMYGVNATDWNNDGWQDILTCAYCRSSGSLFKNNKDGTFTDYTTQSGYTGQLIGGDHGQALCNWEAQPADFDNDGDMDLLQVQVHGGYDKGEGRTHVTINQGPENDYKLVWDLDRLRRDAPPSRTHVGDQGGTWIDIDGDSRLDIAVGQMGYSDAASNTNMEGQSRLYICRQNDTAYFDDITKSLGLFYSMQEAHSMEPCDFDLDGDQDLFVSHQVKDSTGKDTLIEGVTKTVYTYYNRMQVSLLRNDIGNKNNWISVKLDQPNGANKSGLGSRVRVFSNGVNQIREFQAGLGHFAGEQPFIMNFGMKDHNYIDSMIVTWPHKTQPKTVIYNPPMNSIIEIDKLGMKNGLVKNWQDTKPVITCSNPFVKFSNVPAGTTAETSIDIMNIGDAVLDISNIAIVKGTNSTHFSLLNKLDGSKLQPGEKKSLELNFTPDKRGFFNSMIQISSNAFNQPVKLVDIYASGFEEKPVIAFDNVNFTWDSLFLGTESRKTLNIYNKGEQTLKVSDLSFTSNDKNSFYIVNPEKSFSLATGQSKTIEIAFKPMDASKWTEPGTYKATLKIESNAFNTDTNEIKLTGYTNGPAPELSFSPGTIFFGTVDLGSSIEKTLVMFNYGNAPLTVYKIESTEDSNNVYKTVGVTFPFEIPAGGQKDVVMSFTPAVSGKVNISASIYTNAFKDSIQSISFRGTGKEPAIVTDYANDGSVMVVPNPSSGYAELVFNMDLNVWAIEIMDLFGNKLKTIATANVIVSGSRMDIDLSGIGSGSYYLVLKCGSINKILPLRIVR
jgi:hypothetical protein